MSGSKESASHRNASMIPSLPCFAYVSFTGDLWLESKLTNMYRPPSLAIHQTEDVHGYETLPYIEPA